MSTILNVTGLTKNYGRFEALRGIDFEVKERDFCFDRAERRRKDHCFKNRRNNSSTHFRDS